MGIIPPSPDSLLVEFDDRELEVDLEPRPASDVSLLHVVLHTRLTGETTPSPGEVLARLSAIAHEQAARHRPLGDSPALRTVLANLALIQEKRGEIDDARRTRAELESLGR